jgi:hypothetical protein
MRDKKLSRFVLRVVALGTLGLSGLALGAAGVAVVGADAGVSGGAVTVASADTTTTADATLVSWC